MPASILTASTPSRLHQARGEFLSRAEVTPSLLREPVVRSWRRSLGASLSPLEPRVETPRLATAFAAYDWPGNLRQLTNVLRTARALLDTGETEIGRRHLADDFPREQESGVDRPARPTEDLRGLADQAMPPPAATCRKPRDAWASAATPCTAA